MKQKRSISGLLYCVISILLAFSLSYVRAQPVKSAQTDKRTQAIALYNAKDYGGAVKLLDDYLAVNNHDAYGAYYAALANQQLGRSSKACAFYKQVYALAPTTQIGLYSRDILRKLDPGFAATLLKKPKAGDDGLPSTEDDLTKAIAALPPVDDAPALDPTLPAECRVRFDKGFNNVQLDVYIDGRPIKMMLDTGAPGICIGKNQLSQIGAPLPTGKPDGVSGGSSNASTVNFWMTRANVKVGPIERKNFDVKVIEYNSSQPLLGQTFFKDFDYTIDTGGGELVLRQKALSAKTGGIRNAISVPFTFKEEGNRIIVQVEINGKSGPMIFDTGNTAIAVSFFTTAQAQSFGLQIPDEAVVRRHTGVSGSGTALQFPVKRIKLGPIDRSDVEVSVSQGMTSEEGLPLLGQPFWQNYQYTIDMKRKLIHFVRR